MTFFRDSRPPREPRAPLPPKAVAYYRQVLRVHATELDSGLCWVCRVARCADWRDAFDKLALAGEVMAEVPDPGAGGAAW
jgi:hypothetical protein